MFLSDEYFIYAKIPKTMASALIKSHIQALLSCKHDQRSNPARLDVAEYIMLQLSNELGNAEKMTDEQWATLNSVFEPLINKEEEKTDAN